MLHTIEAEKKPDSICLFPTTAEEAEAEKKNEKNFKFGIESSKERDLY